MPKLVILGGPGFGTDAGGWVVDENGTIHKVPGWDPEAVLEFQHAVNIIREATLLKTPGLAEATTRPAVEFVNKEFRAQFQIPEGGIVIGGFGTDAPTVVLNPDGTITKVPGWAAEATLEFQHAVNIIRAATQLKTPGLAEATTRPAIDFVNKEVPEAFGQEGIAVFG